MTNAQLADLLEEAARRLRKDSNLSQGQKSSRPGLSAAEPAAEYGLTVDTIRRYARQGILDGKNFKGRAGYRFEAEKARKALSLHFGNPAERDLARRR